MQPIRPHRRAFTMVEILIVVVIMGIMAMLVVPYYANAATRSKASTALSDLRTARQQILVYQSQHGQRLPTLAELKDNWSVLVQKTDAAGNLGQGNLGPYLRVPPENPFTNSSTVAAPGSGTAKDGWEYNESTGALDAVGFNEETQTYTAPSSRLRRPPPVSPYL